MQAITLSEYAKKIGAKLKPTTLADMPVLDIQENDQPENFHVGMDSIKTWLEVRDPYGGVNGDGYWPFYVLNCADGGLRITSGGY